MRLALRLARKGLGRTSPNPAVGAVVVAAARPSRWPPGPTARRDVQRLRAASDAICVGTGTVLADNPSLTVRTPNAARRPLRVVVDSRARTPPGARVLDGAAPTLVVVTDAAPGERVRRLQEA